MKQYKLLVYSNPTEGNEDAYNRWYNEVHIPDVLKVPGFKAASRMRVSPLTAEGARHNYCAIYEFESDDVGATLAALSGRAASGEMTMSDTIDLKTVEMRAWELI
jgi:hypothetical protein